MEAALLLVATKVLDYVANESIAAGGRASSERVRSWLGRDHQRLAIEVALARTEARFAEAYPQWHGALFDEVFLAGPAAPILARTLTRNQSVTAPELAQAWAHHLGGQTGQRHSGGVEPAAAQLLGWWREELGRHEALRPVLDSRSLDSIAATMEQTGQAMQDLRSDLARALGELDRALVHARYPRSRIF